MSALITPEGASVLAAEFLAILPGMAPAILSGSELRLHQSITAPRSQAKEILDTFELVGSACHAAAASGEDVSA